jgi:hypothetical protein
VCIQSRYCEYGFLLPEGEGIVVPNGKICIEHYGLPPEARRTRAQRRFRLFRTFDRSRREWPPFLCPFSGCGLKEITHLRFKYIAVRRARIVLYVFFAKVHLSCSETGKRLGLDPTIGDNRALRLRLRLRLKLRLRLRLRILHPCAGCGLRVTRLAAKHEQEKTGNDGSPCFYPNHE